MRHLLPELPYALDALAPAMSAETLQFHYGKHLQTYLDNLNRLVAGTAFEEKTLEDIVKLSSGPLFNNVAQAWNHIFFFDTLTPLSKPIGTGLHALIQRDFGSVEAFKQQLTAVAVGHFGSGWAWLIRDESGALKVLSTSNADTMLRDGVTPLLTIDVWEHAYYIDYRNRRADYVEQVWGLIDWEKVENRLTTNLF